MASINPIPSLALTCVLSHLPLHLIAWFKYALDYPRKQAWVEKLPRLSHPFTFFYYHVPKI